VKSQARVQASWKILELTDNTGIENFNKMLIV
jgi:hypothetical protein